MKHRVEFAGIAAALLMASTTANAIVTDWGYSVTSLFTYASYDGSGGTAPGAGTGTLKWGTPETFFGNKSSLVVGNSPAKGSVNTYVGGGLPPHSAPYLGLSTSLTHNNNPITGTSLLSAILTNYVTLDPISPDNSALPVQLFPFNIAFTETPNSGTCAVTGSPTKCNDIFVLTGGLLNSSFSYDAGDGDGLRQYFVNIFPTTGGVLSVLETTACLAARQAANCIGFSTPEGKSTKLAFGFTISTQPLQQVPEPGILALFGLGLLGAFVARRRLH